jgi:hypothetical protein
LNRFFDAGVGKFSCNGHINAPFDQPIERQIVNDFVLNQTLRLKIFRESAAKNRSVLLFVRENSSGPDPVFCCVLTGPRFSSRRARPR